MSRRRRPAPAPKKRRRAAPKPAPKKRRRAAPKPAPKKRRRAAPKPAPKKRRRPAPKPAPKKRRRPAPKPASKKRRAAPKPASKKRAAATRVRVARRAALARIVRARRVAVSQGTYDRAIKAMALYREAQRRGFGISAAEAAAQEGSSVRSMRQVAGPDAFRREKDEWEYLPRDDKALRIVPILERTPDGPRWTQIEVLGLDPATRAGQFSRAIGQGDWARIQSFEGGYLTDTKGDRHYFATDRETLEQLDRDGGLRPAGLWY